MQAIPHYVPYHTLRRVSSPATELMTLAEAKLYLRVDHGNDDLLISEIIVAVRSYAENTLNHSFVGQSWQADYLGEIPTELTLPIPPIQSITSIMARNDAGFINVIAPSTYRLLTPYLLHCDNGLSASVISVTYIAGNNTVTTRDVRQAMLSHAAMCYDMRGTDAPIPAYAKQVYDSYREIRI